MDKIIGKTTNIESFIDNLDERGVMVFQVLLGQQAIKLLSKEKVKKVLNAKGFTNIKTGKED